MYVPIGHANHKRKGNTMKATKQASKPRATKAASFPPSYVTAVTEAVQGAISSEGKWKETAEPTRKQFGEGKPGLAKLDASKDRVLSDLIIPAMGGEYVAAFTANPPHRASKVYKSMGALERAAVDAAVKAKHNATSVALTMFGRMRDYAYGDVMGEKKAPKARKSQLAIVYADLQRALASTQKLEKAPFDLPATTAFLSGRIASIEAANPDLKAKADKKAAKKAAK
jgi:hypothetical protein